MPGGWSVQQRSWRSVALLRQGHRYDLGSFPLDMSILAFAGLSKSAIRCSGLLHTILLLWEMR